MINLYKTYNKAKDIFVKPKLKISFGLWNNVGLLPVWRSGNVIRLGKLSQYYIPSNTTYYKKYNAGDTKEDGSVTEYAVYEMSRHKIPEDAKNGVWKREVRKKLRKIGLGWLKPQYVLPKWLSFHVFNWDVFYKWKYDSIRFEYPPQFTIVFFGLALNFTLKPILEDENDSDDHYWESLLSFLYQKECNKNVTDTLNFCGQWTTYKNGKEINFFQLRKSHLKPEYHEEYNKALKKYNRIKKQK
jgi:hypothetical protein